MKQMNVQNADYSAETVADRKLMGIISQYGNADGKRYLPAYRAQLVKEAEVTIGWQRILMDIAGTSKNAPKPTKVTEAF